MQRNNDNNEEMTLDLNSEFQKLGDHLGSERRERIEAGKNLLTTGVTFLDEALGGIATKDLLIVASKTGVGKSQFVAHIALANVRLGKRVHIFALEAERLEVERRIKYQFISDLFFRSQNRSDIKINYMDWFYGRLDSELGQYEEAADKELMRLSTLFIYYRKNEFYAKDFQRLALSIKDHTDLIIVDHLQYFDSDNPNENRATSDIVKMIRDTALLSEKPVVLVSHVRKTDKRLKQIVPDIEDLHGSSDISKIGTKVITIAPSQEKSSNTERKTLISISKCRIDGARSNHIGLLTFDLVKQRYEAPYKIGRLSFDGFEFEPMSGLEKPFWAKSAIDEVEKELIDKYEVEEVKEI